jgi:hypothetical protein
MAACKRTQLIKTKRKRAITGWKLISLHLIHPPIFEYHPDQSLRPIEQSGC